MKLLNDIVNDLKEDKLLDETSDTPYGRLRNQNVSKLGSNYKYTFEESAYADFEKIYNKNFKFADRRYSVNSLKIDTPQFLPQPRMRLVKKGAKLTRICKCCSANVFIFDAFCPNCNERLIGNFLYYSFFIVTAILIGFMIFWMATSNPY